MSKYSLIRGKRMRRSVYNTNTELIGLYAFTFLGVISSSAKKNQMIDLNCRWPLWGISPDSVVSFNGKGIYPERKGI